MALSASLNKSTYSPGEQMTLTVDTAAGERGQDVPISIHIEVTGIGSTDITATLDKPDAPIVVTDPNRTWTLQSDSGTSAVFRSVA